MQLPGLHLAVQQVSIMRRTSLLIDYAASEVKEYHRGGQGHADASKQQTQNVYSDHASGEHSCRGRTATDRQVKEPVHAQQSCMGQQCTSVTLTIPYTASITLGHVYQRCCAGYYYCQGFHYCKKRSCSYVDMSLLFRTHFEGLATETAAATFAAYNAGRPCTISNGSINQQAEADTLMQANPMLTMRLLLLSSSCCWRWG